MRGQLATLPTPGKIVSYAPAHQVQTPTCKVWFCHCDALCHCSTLSDIQWLKTLAAVFPVHCHTAHAMLHLDHSFCLRAMCHARRGAHAAGQETNARRSPNKAEEAPTQLSASSDSNPRGKKGSKFAQIRAQEAARKAARTAASGLAQASGQSGGVLSWACIMVAC